MKASLADRVGLTTVGLEEITPRSVRSWLERVRNSADGRSASSRAAARLHDFVGLDLLLSVDDLEMATVTKIYRPGPGKRPLVEKLTDTTLLDALAPA